MSLLDTLSVKQIAFEWDNTTRVYRCDRLTIEGQEQGEDWQYADGTMGDQYQGVWLSYQIESRYHERVSPSGAQGNDWIDILNALTNNGTDVTFYPIYSVDNSVSYTVKLDKRGRTLLDVEKNLYAPEITLDVRNQSRLDSYPKWLRVTRER